MSKRSFLTLIASAAIVLGVTGLGVAQVASSTAADTNTLPKKYRYSGPHQPLLPDKPVSAFSQHGGTTTAPPGAAIDDAHGDLVTFDAPGAGTAAGQGTTPVAINETGDIAGNYIDESNVYHGFLRSHDCMWDFTANCGGIITTFDVPGAGTGPYQGTYAEAINSEGVIAGYFTDPGSVAHGFLWSRDCDHNGCKVTSTTVDDPYAGSEADQGTTLSGIDPAGSVIGSYVDVTNVIHGFLATRNCDWTHGKQCSFSFVNIDPPGAEFTFPVAIDSSGAITGSYCDASNACHGLLRATNGCLTVFDVPGGGSPAETNATALNGHANVTGNYFEQITGNPFGGNFRGFVRSSQGNFITFDAATYSPCCIWTYPTGINSSDLTTGYLNDGYDRNRGFLRGRDGTISVFDLPGAGTGPLQGTLPAAINNAGQITGAIRDASSVDHGFLLYQLGH